MIAMPIAEFRFYAELNAFLSPVHRQRAFLHACARDATVKHMIEALGVPHTEVELILANGVPVDFSHRIAERERIAVYPHFRTLDVSTVATVRHDHTGPLRFIADAHLGQLAKQLRMLGFDVLYRNDFSDGELVRIGREQQRIVLTRDRDLLMRKDVLRGSYLHSIDTEEQLREIFARYDLAAEVKTFSRCLNCNGELHAVDKTAVHARLPVSSAQHYEHFFECDGCAQLYWEGSHVTHMRHRVALLLERCVQRK